MNRVEAENYLKSRVSPERTPKLHVVFMEHYKEAAHLFNEVVDSISAQDIPHEHNRASLTLTMVQGGDRIRFITDPEKLRGLQISSFSINDLELG